MSPSRGRSRPVLTSSFSSAPVSTRITAMLCLVLEQVHQVNLQHWLTFLESCIFLGCVGHDVVIRAFSFYAIMASWVTFHGQSTDVFVSPLGILAELDRLRLGLYNFEHI